MAWRPLVPWSLVILRVLLGPAMILGADRRWYGFALTAIVGVASLTDVYDGILARRWQCVSKFGSIADSLADTIFYLGVAAALWILYPESLRANREFLAALFFLEALRYAFDLWKFHKSASYHSYLARIWGTVMAAAVIAIFSFHGLSPLLRLALIRISVLLGILADLEGLVMSLLFPRWQQDVPTLFRAIAVRKQMRIGDLTQSASLPIDDDPTEAPMTVSVPLEL